MELGEHPDMHPSQSFRAENPPQFQSQYPYPQGASAFTVDQDMSMSTENFAAAVQAHANTPLGPAVGAPDANSSTNNMHASTAAMTTPGMAPPQGAGHPYSPGGARPSLDEGQDVGFTGGDPKRKRSKVSRACDECRRKKVRCDAAADDGSIKTCSNCARAGLTCDYSRVPMKRGPSKGYIKELSERVQQVESLQMALSNTPSYRQSLDATGGVYAEQPYSPEDPMSLKRNFSFSAEQRSPFVGAEYHRDRMPSVGGWHAGSPHSANFRARDRGSIALAPDQQPASLITFSKPFWAQDAEGSPSAKRQKMDLDSTTKPVFSLELLRLYYHRFHPYLPILPDDGDVAVAIAARATSEVQHAFATALQNLPVSRKHLQGDDADTSAKTMISSHFTTQQDLEEFMWNVAREAPEHRSAEDNLLYLWAYLFMAIEAEDDLSRLHDGHLPRTVLIKQAVDLGWTCVVAASDYRKFSSGSDFASKAQYLNEFARAWHCATIPARLHALAVGSSSPIPRYFHQHAQKKVPTFFEVLPVSGLIVALTAGQLTTVSRVVQSDLPQTQWGRNMDMEHRMTIQETFDQTINVRQYAVGNEALLEQLGLYLDLTLSRCSVNFHPMDIVIPAAALAEALRKHMAASNETVIYNPFHLHFFALTTITLLEFLSEGHETELFRIASSGAEDIKAALEHFSGQSDFGAEQQDNSSGVDVSETTVKPVRWSDALLKMIEERLKNVTAPDTNGTNNSTTEATKTLGDGTNATVDFSMLLKHGYLTVLVQQLG